MEQEDNELRKQRYELDKKERELEKQREIERNKEVKRAVYRSDSKTEWTDDMLETLRNEMLAEMAAQKAAAIDEMTMKQFEFRAPSIDQTQMSVDRIQTFVGQYADVAPDLPPVRPFRMNSKTDWDEEDMEKLREAMKNEMMLQKQENMERWFNR